MIRVPGHLANAPAPFPPAALPDLSAAGLDTARAAEAVRRGGGEPELFARALAAGLAEHPAALGGRERMLDLAAVAAWRAGVLGVRADALARTGAAGEPEDRLAAAAALGIPPDQLEPFLRRQQTDRHWWPGRARHRGFVFAVGGFRGLGGAWIRPPERVVRFEDAGAFALLVAGDWWRLDGDVWGSRLTALDAEPPAAAPRDDGVTLVIAPDTHLAWLHVRETG